MKRVYAQGILTAIIDVLAPKKWSNATCALLASLGAAGATYLVNELIDEKKPPRRRHSAHGHDAPSMHHATNKPATRSDFAAREVDRRSARRRDLGEPGSPSR